jgi:hypothetical protein
VYQKHKKKGKGQMIQQNIATAAEEKCLSELFNAPLTPHEMINVSFHAVLKGLREVDIYM